MTTARDALAAELRDFNVAGDPSSGAYEPAKAGIRDAFLAVLDEAAAASTAAAEAADIVTTAAQQVIDQVGGVAAILGGTLYLESYGIVKNDPSAAAANATGLAALFADAESTGKAIDLTSGDVYLAGQITRTFSKKLCLTGRGEDVTRFIWPSAPAGDAGFKFTYTNVQRPPEICGFSILTGSTGAESGTKRGLQILTPPVSLVPGTGPRVEHVRFRGSDEVNYLGYWDDALYMEESWYPELVRIGVNGRNAVVAPFAATTGIRLKNVQAPIIRDPLVFWAQTGVLLEGTNWHEGLQYGGGELVGVDVGIGDLCTFGRSGISIHDGHINAFRACIQSQFRADLAVHDMLLFKTGGTEDWVGVQVGSADRADIHHNRIACPNCTPASGTANGVILGGGSNHSVTENRFFAWGGQAGVCVLGVGGTDYNEIAGNSRYSGGPTSIAAGVGANTVVTGNLPNNS